MAPTTGADATHSRVPIETAATQSLDIRLETVSRESLRETVRAVAAQGAGRVAASAWNGLLAVRLLAVDGQTLRRDVAAVLAVLRGGEPLPRVWTC